MILLRENLSKSGSPNQVWAREWWSNEASPIEDFRLQIADFSEEPNVDNLGQNLKSTILNLKSLRD